MTPIKHEIENYLNWLCDEGFVIVSVKERPNQDALITFFAH